MEKEYLPKTIRKYADVISDYYTDNEGESFGKAAGTVTHWVELKEGYKAAGFTIIHEATLKDCASLLKSVRPVK